MKRVLIVMSLLTLVAAGAFCQTVFTWTGGASTVWENGSNWSGGSGADWPGQVAGDTAIIPGTATQPTLGVAPAQYLAELRLTAATSNLTLNANIGADVVNLNLAGAALTTAAARSISVRDDLNVVAGCTVSVNITFIMEGSAGTAPYNVNSVSTLGNLLVSTGATVTLAANLTLAGYFQVSAGIFTASTFQINVAGNWTVAGAATFDAATGTVVFNGASSNLTPGGTDLNHDFNNFEVAKGANTLTLLGPVDINGTLTATSGAMAAGANDVTLAGSFTFTLGTFSSGATLSFDAGAAQTFNPTAGSTFTTIATNKTGGSLTVSTSFTATTLSTNAAAYNVALNGTATTVTTDTTFANTGSVLLGDGVGGDILTFTGGLSTTAAVGGTSVGGTVRTAGQQIDLGAVTLLGASTVDSSNNGGSAAGAIVNIASVATGGGFALTLRSRAGATTVAGAVGSVSAVGVLTLHDANAGSTGLMRFNGNVIAGTLATVAAGYSVELRGVTTTVTTDTTFANTGSVLLGDGVGGDILTFTGGLDTTAAVGGTSVGGTVRTAGQQIDLGAVTLLGASTVDSSNNGGSAAGAIVNIASVATGGGFALTLRSRAGATTVAGAVGSVSAVGVLTLHDANAGSTGLMRFNGNVIAGTLATVAAGYSVELRGVTTTVTTDTTFANTGSVLLGDGVGGDILTFTGGLDTTAAVGGTSVGGTVRTAGQQIDLGAVTLLGASTVDSSNNGGSAAGAIVNIASVATGGGFALTLRSRAGATTVAGAVGSVSAVGVLTLHDANAGSTGLMRFNGNVIAGTLATVAAGYSVELRGVTTTVTTDTTFANTGSVLLGDGVGGDILTFTGGLDTTAAVGGTSVGGTVRTAGQQIDLGAVTLLGASTVDSSNNGGSAAGAIVNIASVATGGGFALTLRSRAGATTVAGAVGSVSAVGVLTLHDANAGSTGLMRFNGNVIAGTLATVAAGYSVELRGVTTTVTTDTTFANTGSVLLGDGVGGDILTFTGGLDTTAAVGGTSVGGTVRTAGQQIDLGAVTLLGASTVDSSNNGGSAAGAIVNIASVATGGGFALTLRSRAGATTVAGAVGSVSAVGVLTLHDANAGSTGLMRFNGNVIAGTLATVAAGYSVELRGVTTTVTTDTTFANTGSVLLGDGVGGDILTFTGGLDTTVAVGGTSVGGTVRTAGQQIDLGAVTLLGASTVDSSNNGGSAAGAIVNIASVATGGGFALTLRSRAGATTVAGAVGSVSAVGVLTLQDANASSTGTMIFNGAVTAGSLVTVGAPANYSVQLNGGGTITAATSFLNTGTVALGNDAGDNLVFTGGVNTTGGPTLVNVAGTVATTGTGMSFGDITFVAATTLNSGGGNIAAANIVGGSQNLTLAAGIAGGTTTVSGNVSTLGSGTGAALTISGGVTGLVTIQGIFGGNSGVVAALATSNVRFNGDVTLVNGDTATSLPGAVQLDGLTFSGFDGLTFGALTLSTAAVTLNSNGSAIAIGSIPNGNAQNLTLLARAGGATMAGAVGSVSAVGVLTLQDANAGSTGAMIFNGAVTANTLTTVGAPANYSVQLNAGGTITTATSFLNTGTVALGNDAADILVFTGGVDTTGGPTGTSVAGAVRSAGQPIALGAVTLAANTTVDSSNAGASALGATIDIASVAGATFNLTLQSRAGVTTVSGNLLNVGTLTLHDNNVNSTGAMVFNGQVGSALFPVTTLTTVAQNHAIQLNAGGQVTAAMTFSNTGAASSLTIALGFTFSGGVTATAPAARNIAGTVTAAAGVLNFGGANPVTITGNATIGGATAGPLTLGSTTINNGFTLTLGNGGATVINATGTIDGPLAGLTSNLTIDTTAAVTVTGAVGTNDIGTVTISNCSTATFNNNFIAATLVTVGLGYSVAFNGTTTTVTTDTTFANTGAVTLGNGVGGDILTFTGGLDTTVAVGGTSVGGTVRTAGQQIDLGAVTLLGASTVDSSNNGGSAAGAIVNIASVATGGGFALTLRSRAGATTVAGAVGSVSAVGVLTLQDANASSTGTMIFNGAVTAGSLVTVGAPANYSVQLNGGGTITAATSFLNTGTVALGNDAGDNLVFTGGVNTTGGPTLVNVAGTVATTGTGMSFGDITLVAATTLNSGGGNIAAANIVGGSQNLTLAAGIAGGTTTVSGNVSTLGSGTGAALTISGGVTGLVTIQGIFGGNSGVVAALATSNVRFNGDVTLVNGDTATSLPGAVQLDGLTFSGFDGLTFGALTLSTAAVTLNSNGSAIAIGSIPNGNAQNLTLLARAGGATMAGAVGSVSAVGVLTLQDANAGSTGAMIFNGAVTANTLTTVGAPANYSVQLNAGGTITTATSFLNTGTVALGNDAADILVFTGGVDTTGGPTGTSVAGAVRSAGQPIALGAVTLAANTTVDSSNAGASALGATIDIASVAGATFNLTLQSRAGVTTVSGNLLNVGTLTLHDNNVNSTGAMVFNGQVGSALFPVTTLTTVAQNHAIQLNAGGQVTAAMTFSNTGAASSLTIALGFTFSGGVTATAPAARNIAGTVTAAAGVLNFGGANPVTITGNATIGGATAGPLTLGSTTINNGFTLTLGNGGATVINATGTIDGPLAGLTSNLTIDTTAAVTVTGAVGTNDIGTVTISNCSTATFNNNFIAATLVTVGLGYSVAFNGTTTTVTTDTTFANTGAVTLGNGAGGDILTFTGGLDTTVAVGGTSVGGTVRTAGQQIDLGAVTLLGASTVDSSNNGGSAAGAIVNIASVATGGGFALTLRSRAGATTVAGAVGSVSAVGVLTLQDANASSTGTMIFNGAETAGSLVTVGAPANYSVYLMAGGTITNPTTFNNTGVVQVGDNVADSMTFSMGVNSSAASGGTFLGGAITTGGFNMSFSAVTLAAPTTLNSTGGNISMPGIAGNMQNLTLAAGIGAGTTTVTGVVNNLGSGTGAALTVGNLVTGLVQFQNTFGANSGIAGLGAGNVLRFNNNVTLGNGDTATSMLGETRLSGATFSCFDGLTFALLTLLGNVTLTTNGSAIAITAGVAGGGFNLGLQPRAGGATVSGAVTNVGTLTLHDANAGSTGAMIFNGAVTANTLTTVGAPANYSVQLNAGGTITAATSFLNAGTVALGNDAADILVFTGGVDTTGGPSGTTVAGAVRSAGQSIALGAVTLAANTTIDSSNAGASALGATIDIASVAGATFNLTLQSRAGVTTVSGNLLNVGTLSLHDNHANSTGAMVFNGLVGSGLQPVAAIATVAQNHAIQLNGAGTVTAAAIFSNIGAGSSLTIASGFTFTGGATATQPATVSLAGAVTAAGAAALNFNSSAVIIPANATLGGAAQTGAVTIGPATIAAGSTLSLGSGGATPILTAAISGTAPGSNITVNTSVTATVNGTIGPNISVVTTSLAATVLDVNNEDFTIATLTNNGTFRLDGTQATQAVTTMTMVSGTVQYYDGLADGTIRLDTFYSLEIAGLARTFTLNQDITVGPAAGGGQLRVTGGTFDVSGSNRAIMLRGDWDNQGVFNPRSGRVTFAKPAGIITILGNNTWYEFWCTIPGIQIQFEAQKTQTMANYGSPVFHVQGTGWGGGQYIELSSTNWANPAGAVNYWHFSVSTVTLLEMLNVWVDCSSASPTITTPPVTDVQLRPVEGVQCPGWIRQLLVIANQTEDLDGNGKIERIHAWTVSFNNSDFSDFHVTVTGYTLATPAFKGWQQDGSIPHDQFYILLEELPALDTGATPQWTIDSNNSLRDELLGGYYLATLPVSPATPNDAAPPLIGYTLAVADKDQIYVQFSEPVTDGGAIGTTSFTFKAANPLSVAPVGASGYLLTVSAAIAASEVVAPLNLTASGGIRDAALNAIASTVHRVSDLGLGLTATGIIEPVWAHDQTISGAATTGLGRINLFDGSRWLRDQDITVTGSVHTAIALNPDASPDAKLWYDVSVAGSLKSASGLWLPPFVGSTYNGIVPYQDSSARSVTGSPVGGQNHDYAMPGSDAEIVDGSRLEFLFQILANGTTVGNDLYCARVTDPAALDWYLRCVPWAFDIHEIKMQKGSVNILNNVINPDLAQVVTLQYVQPTKGSVTVSVFDLAGNLVRVLTRVSGQDIGDYAITWDGKNKGGRSVARGIYFIRVVAPGIDETRKVLVVR